MPKCIFRLLYIIVQLKRRLFFKKIFCRLALPALFVSMALGPVACTSIDCPLDNVVALKCGLYDNASGSRLSLSQTLTVRAGGQKDTILLNAASGIGDFLLPLRYGSVCDTLLFEFSDAEGRAATDSVFLSHRVMPHFESIDCPAAMFHELGGVRHTSHPLSLLPLTIDSIAVVRKIVNYDDIENLKIYLRSTAVQP